MTTLLYEIPAKLVEGYLTGRYQLYGAVLKDAASGLIVGQVQQTGLLEPLLRNSLNLVSGGPASVLTSAITGGVTMWQNHKIAGQLSQMQASLALMQNLSVAGLLVSGLGLGVSVVGFAAMNARLKAIGRSLDDLSGRVEAVTRDRREDELKSLLQRIEVHLETVDGLETRKQGFAAADRASDQLRDDAGALYGVLDREVARAAPESAEIPDVDRILGVTATIRIVHEASTRAMFLMDEVEEAGRLAGLQGRRLMDHTSALSPDALARIKVFGTEPPEAAIRARREALPRARIVAQDLRQSSMMIASQQELAQMLGQRGVSGRQYLSEVSAAKDAPLMFLPAAKAED
ncbi:hypothetical protein [Neotabrizicola shimadae]|uniref:Uncharacterized protein n=1 Tax=Neotabrizicola shimadae TaxID=2807096 RepID=A0A8G0ZW24_9RHOB|nr:hypothetical protein [Neotabrizicola shimadae]QYZ71192.1 hypothetical protein JO391_06725 [Neotabrizicola shimadae]